MSIQYVQCKICKSMVDAVDCVVKPIDDSIHFEYTCNQCNDIIHNTKEETNETS